MEFCILRPYYPLNSVQVMFLNFVFYERTGSLHVLKIGCFPQLLSKRSANISLHLSVSFFCFRWFKQILRRNITSRTRLRSCRYKFNFKITLANSALIAWVCFDSSVCFDGSQLVLTWLSFIGSFVNKTSISLCQVNH